MKRLLLFTLFSTLFTVCVLGQNINTDSVVRLIPSLEGQKRIDAYQYAIINNWLNLPDKAMTYAHQAVAYAKLQNDAKLNAIAIRLLGGVHLYKGNYDSALYCGKETYRISSLLGDSVLIASAFNNIGFTYYHFGNYPMALENLLKALQMKYDLKIDYGLGQTLNNVGLVYYRLKDYERARRYFEDAVQVSIRLNDKNIRLYSFNNIANTFLDENNLTAARNYFNKAMDVARFINNANWHSVTYSGLAQIYKREGQTSKARQYFRESLQLRKSIGDKQGIASVYYFLSEIFLEAGNYDSARVYLGKSQQLARQAKIRQRALENFELAKRLYEAQRMYDSALYFQTNYIQLRDSLFNENMVRELADIQMSIREEEARKQLASKDLQLSRKTTVTNFLIVIFLLGLLFSFALYRSYKLQKELGNSLRKSNADILAKNKEIQEQKESLLLNNEELEDVRERIHLQNQQLEELNRHLQTTVDLRTRELDVASRELRIVSLELDNFIYKSSHDIKGPLVRLLGICHVALLDVQDEKAKEYIQMLYESARHLNDIFDRLKVVSDINASTVSKQRIDFKLLVDKVFADLQTMDGFSEIEVYSEVDPSIQYESDSFLLETIFHNMLENAVRFQKKSTVQKKIIAANVTLKSNFLVISFIDNGIGIKENDMEQIFKMFSRAALQHHNVGLGLYIVRQCVHKLEGTIRLVKNANGYTEFQITLPYRPVHEFA